MEPAAVRDIADDIPAAPGCYYFLAGETILYVGKAVDVRDRIRTYADPRSERVGRMVQRADDIDVALTDTETQALLLEANLIKRHQPRYNVRLKDDKSYPLVQLTDHPFPRIEITRDPDDTADVFGPFTSRGRLEEVVKALRETYGLRGCTDHKYSNRDRPCLDYDIGLCAAPCVDEIDRAAYGSSVEAASRFFGGETGVLKTPLEREMEEASTNHRFERAAHLRDRLQIVDSFHGDSASAVIGEEEARTLDVLGVAVSGEQATVARLHSENGKLVDRDRHRVSVPEGTTGDVPAVLAAFIPQYYAERELPEEILVPEDPADADLQQWLSAEGVVLEVPGPGRKATLVELALKNARSNVGADDAVGALGDALGIDPPSRIEGFDVSHAHGADVVGSNVTFVDGHPETSGYRRKKLPEQNDDVANMRALIAWRVDREIAGRDERPTPDLLVIDGGETQLEAARSVLKERSWNVPAIGIAKAEERVIDEHGEIRLESATPALNLIRRVRDEAHRFAVQYHQSVRDDVSTALEEIGGIGPTRRRRLLRRFGSLDGIRTASPRELQGVEGIGERTATRIAERL